jgi:hypothetical protein
MAAPSTYHSSTAAFFGGVRSALASVFFLVIMGTYTGIGALAHDFGLNAWWLALSAMPTCWAIALRFCWDSYLVQSLLAWTSILILCGRESSVVRLPMRFIAFVRRPHDRH